MFLSLNLATAKGVLILFLGISFKKATKATSIKHNNREFKKEDWESPFHDHIDPERTHQNVVLVQTDIHEKYEELFGEAVQEYNEKQKRKDRKIKDFYQKVKNDGNLELQREFVVQVGQKADFDNNPQNWALANDLLIEYVREFEQVNPNLKIYNAVIHNDEASPHLHLNVIPVATGYKKGVAIQPSFNKALLQQGIVQDPKDSRSLFRNFRNQEVSRIDTMFDERGIERYFAGTNKLKDFREYKLAMQKVQEVEQKGSELVDNFRSKLQEGKKRVELAETHLNALEDEIESKESELASYDQKIIEKDRRLQEQDRLIQLRESELTSKVDELEKNINTSKIILNRLEDEIEGNKSKIAEYDSLISEKESALSKKTQLLAQATDEIDRTQENYRVHLHHLSGMAHAVPLANSYSDDKLELVSPYMPNRLGTDREAKANKIYELVQLAQNSKQVERVLQENVRLSKENTTLRMERTQAIDEAVKQATAPLHNKIAEQNQEIHDLKAWIDIASQSIKKFKKVFGEKYSDFLTYFGMKMREKNVNKARKITSNSVERTHLEKGYNMDSIQERRAWKDEHFPEDVLARKQHAQNNSRRIERGMSR